MKLTMKSWMLALLMLLGLASCTESDSPVSYEGIEVEKTPDLTEPTEDQKNVMVTADLPTAVLRPFDEGTTGAALVSRLSKVTNAITPETRMVLLRGDLFKLDNPDITENEMLDIARLYLNGGYVAVERQTGEQTASFALMFLAAILTVEEADLEQMFDIDKAAATRAAQHSETVERLMSRQRNLQAATTRGSGESLDELFAEMIVLGSTDYFMQEPLPDETTVYTHSSDADGNETAPEAVTTKIERTPFVSGLLADAAAEWLNEVEKRQQQSATPHALTRASGSTAINEMMDASETFTYSGAVDWKTWDNRTKHYINRVLTTVRSWGIHNMESNKDYYYVKQNVTLRMGAEGAWKIFFPVSGANYWYDATNYSSYNRWYGSFLSQYETSMNLTGNGNIHLEASVPNTDNNSQTTNITIGSSTSNTTTSGISWGASGGANASGPMGSINIGGSYSEGTTTGTSFSMSMSQTNKDFGVRKNTSGNKVTWTYKGTLPQYYEHETSSNISYCHQTPANILVNDCDVANEICWSVSNPSGQYTVDITSAPQTAAIVYVYKKKDGYKNAPHKYEYATASTENYTHKLIEPNRAMQNWRMYITIDEWSVSPVVGAQGDLESNIRHAFPDLYANVFTIADKTPTSLNTIGYIVKHTKRLFTQNIDILQSYAKSWGIKQYTIHWRCDDTNVSSREGFSVKVD